MGRTVNIVLVDATGALLGALPALDVESPWWQNVDDVVPAVRARHGIDVAILRLLYGTGGHRPAAGGEVTYLAQLSRPAELAWPVARLRGAVIYRDFVANIEPAEHVYHDADVAGRLSAAVRSARTPLP